MSGFQQKLQERLKKARKKQSVEGKQVPEPDSDITEMLKFSEREILNSYD